MSTLSERIAEVIASTELPKGVFASRVGVTAASVTFWLDGTTKNLKAAVAQRIGQVSGYRVKWLVDGTGPKKETEVIDVQATWLDDHSKPVQALESGGSLHESLIQVRESQVRFSAGPGRSAEYEEIEDSVPATYRLEWFNKEGIKPENTRRFKVHGNSMESLLFDGDTVLVNMVETDVVSGKVYAIRYGDELRIKRLFKKLDGGLILRSDNPDHIPQNEEVPPATVDEHITVLGRVRDKSGRGGL